MNSPSARRLTRMTVYAVAAIGVGYLVLLTQWHDLRSHVPDWLQWYGRPGSWESVAIGAVLIFAVAAARFGGARRPGAPLALVAGLGLFSLVVGMMSFWHCYDDDKAPRFFRPLMWAASLVKGKTDDLTLNGAVCPSPAPVALEVARLSALCALFLSVLGVAATLFQTRLDRLRVRLARSVTVIVDMDDDAQSMVSAIAKSVERRSTLVVITASADRPCVQEARQQGARVVTVDFTRPDTMTSLSSWRKLDRLYLLSADPSSNLLRLRSITARMDEVGRRQRIPLIVRIDDPWQAAAWRSRHFGGSETRWAADAVGRYEVTARQLLDRIVKVDQVQRILICGTSRLILALWSDLTQRQLEHEYYAAPDDSAMPEVVLVAENAAEYQEDLQHARASLAVGSDRPRIRSVSKAPDVPALSALLKGAETDRTAVILVDADGGTARGVDATVGTRLAARFPNTPIYAWDPSAEVTEDRLSIVGRLRTYSLTMDTPGGQAQDAWERAARLIHDRYASEASRAGHQSAASVPWADLDEFYRGSNRRQVLNALWMVERIGGHTWNSANSAIPATPVTNLRGLDPVEQLSRMGFGRDAITKMARAEHEDWCRYYRAAGWQRGTPRNDARKIHDKLLPWSAIEADPDSFDTAVSSLAATLSRLRELGYRSVPVDGTWQTFHRAGDVIAKQMDQAWTWTTHSGSIARARAGDWRVREVDADDAEGSWSVRDDIFRATYAHVVGDQWRRHGVVKARQARAGEVVETLEGPVTASEGDWVVRGGHNDQWPVPADDFARHYAGPDDADPAPHRGARSG